jgi:CysZ protein
VLVGLIALALLFVPGLGIVAWIGANGYLLGREYFELAAMRFRSAGQAREMRRRYALLVFTHGLLIAGFVAVPLLNLLTPLFATTLMARLHKRLA